MAKRTRIRIETDSLLVLRGQKSLRAWCPRCGTEAEVLQLSDVGLASDLVQAWMESPDLHHTKTVTGDALICLNSILKRSRRTMKEDLADLLRNSKT